MEIHNMERAQHGVQPLYWDYAASDHAESHVQSFCQDGEGHHKHRVSQGCLQHAHSNDSLPSCIILTMLDTAR